MRLFGWKRRTGGKPYPGADAAIAGPRFEVLERLAVEIKGDGAAVAASAVVFGRCVRIGYYFGAAGRGVLRVETSAVIGFDFDAFDVEVFEGADLAFFVKSGGVFFGETFFAWWGMNGWLNSR